MIMAKEDLGIEMNLDNELHLPHLLTLFDVLNMNKIKPNKCIQLQA